jgi:gluconate 5-dehydrogenase
MKNLFDLTDKVAIVTGASSGLGAQFAKALAGQGAKLALVARRVDRLTEVKKEIEKLGVECITIKCDVTNNDDIKRVVKEVVDHYGRIDILVNNAGVARLAPSHLHTDEDWNTVIDVNLNAVFFFAREVGAVMLKQKYGKIINLGSIHSLVTMPGLPITAYCASKGGVLMMTKALAAEWAKEGITVNAIAPSYFPSEMTAGVTSDPKIMKTIETFCPMGRLGKPEELSGAVIYFASDASSFTTGQILAVDGGWTAV